MPKPRTTSKGLPKGLRRDVRGGPILARRHIRGTGEATVVDWRSTGTRIVQEAARIRDEWAQVIEDAIKRRPTAATTSPEDAVKDYLRFKRTDTAELSPEHLDAVERHLTEFVAVSRITKLEQLTRELVGETLESIRLNPPSRRKRGGRTETRERRRAERAAAAAEKAGASPSKAEPRVLSNASIDARITSLKAFTKWLTERDVFFKDPLMGMRKKRREPTRPKGAMTLPEMMRLIDGVSSLPRRFNMTGAERRVCYAAAIATGIRVTALAALRVRDWEFYRAEDGQLKCVVRLLKAKDRKKDGKEKPVLSWAAPILFAWMEGRSPEARAMPEALHRWYATKMLQADLESLGIPLVDRMGRRTFHSLRASVLTVLAYRMSSTSTASFGDHTDIKTTDRYYLKRQVVDLGNEADSAWEAARIQHGFAMPLSVGQSTPSGSESSAARTDSATPIASESPRMRLDTPSMRAENEEPPAGLEPATSRLQIRCSAS